MSESVGRPLYAVPPQGHIIPLYAATLHAAVARNDVDELDGLPSLIEQLKTEIARLER